LPILGVMEIGSEKEIMKELEELRRKQIDLQHALEAKGAQWVMDPDKPEGFRLVFPSKDYITPEVERIQAEWVRIKEKIERLRGPTE
jgi:hypothetical protein